MTAVSPAARDERAPSAPPTRPGRRRAAWSWVAIAAFLVVVGSAAAALSGIGEWSDRGALDPESAGPDGARAVAELLRSGGVDVEVARDRDDALDALARQPDATLVTVDSPLLSDESLRGLFAAATDVVLIDPRARGVAALIPGATAGTVAPATAVAPHCDQPDAARAGTIVPGRVFVPDDATDVSACYPAADGFGLLVAPHDGGRAVVVDGHEVVANDRLADEGNAALALGLMGRREHLVWYVPSVDDAEFTAPPTLGELTPGWVTPAIVLLAGAAAAAAMWRGRRFGPLVHERLPVTVRASETMQGRARLYARGRDHAHAARALRVGTLGRIAGLVGVGAAASDEDVADSAAALLDRPREAVRGILVDDVPRTDRDLLALSDGLREIETAVHAAVNGEGRTG
ncbi:DUF4350 domain-containing protein [Microbacterium sp. LRZ72]|uniref:DUF4350 domain-containing protein n=1 Tax=Microbacterium sp. LRZ72 TaxID=2942481 RepID=UPI0029B8409A|nr:DUF4350 domain-containing protein [Microbacterium sp. LRZ72]MDX2377050.1 DUF4350 domain-containing protein [Microbacterium sp. LRZ72]